MSDAEIVAIDVAFVPFARDVRFQASEAAVSRELLAAVLQRIQRFGVATPSVQRR